MKAANKQSQSNSNRNYTTSTTTVAVLKIMILYKIYIFRLLIIMKTNNYAHNNITSLLNTKLIDNLITYSLVGT